MALIDGRRRQRRLAGTDGTYDTDGSLETVGKPDGVSETWDGDGSGLSVGTTVGRNDLVGDETGGEWTGHRRFGGFCRFLGGFQGGWCRTGSRVGIGLVVGDCEGPVGAKLSSDADSYESKIARRTMDTRAERFRRPRHAVRSEAAHNDSLFGHAERTRRKAVPCQEGAPSAPL